MRIRTPLIALTGGILLIAATGAALAGAGGWGGPHRMGGSMRFFETFDTDGDGKVTEAEIVGVRDGRFDQFDSNKDGTLSLEEYQALWVDAMRRNMVRQFQRHDENGNAALTKEEFRGGFGMMVERLDENGDDAVTRDELRRRHGAPGRGPGGPGDPDDRADDD